MNLNLIILIPLLTVAALFFTKDLKRVRTFAAGGMTAQLIAAIYLVISYLRARAGGASEQMLFGQDIMWFESLNIRYTTGVDGLSVALILLTAVVIFAGVFASWRMEKWSREFFISLILLSTGVFGFFISLDLFLMFLFYEIAVIPMYLLIGIWGSGQKEYSAMKLTLMLMGGSALLLVSILGIYFYAGQYGAQPTFNILEIAKINFPLGMQKFFFPFAFIGFGVLGALFPFHTWSPDGHASAPTAVSMLHAGVLMKLGGFGTLRVATFLLPGAAHDLAWIFIILTAISTIYGAFGAVMQKDLKYINAYSSVSHCGLVLFAILMLNKTAINGAILQMLSHGLMCALFFGLIGMLYSRTHTRDIYKMGGLMKTLPFISAAYVIASLTSLGLPGLSGFVAEMTIFVGAFSHPDWFHRTVTIIAVASIVVTAVYILRAVAIMLMGPEKTEYNELKPAEWQERLAAGVLIVAIVGMGIAPLWLSDMITDSLGPIMERLTLVQ